MSRKVQPKKIIIEEESDIESDVESVIESDVESQVDDDIDDSEFNEKKGIADGDDIEDDIEDDGDDADDEDVDDEDGNRIYMKKVAQQKLLKENSEVIIVDANKRITSEFMTIYEYAMVIGTRATHISEGSPLYVDATGISEARDIAIKEIDEKKCPLSISRKVDYRKIEIWEVNELTKPLL